VTRRLLARWRDQIRDSQLDASAKVTAFVLSSYMDANGEAWPAQQTLAAGTSLSVDSIHRATVRLQHAGFLDVTRSRGRGAHVYQARLLEQPHRADVQRPHKSDVGGRSTSANGLSNIRIDPFQHPQALRNESAESAKACNGAAFCGAPLRPENYGPEWAELEA